MLQSNKFFGMFNKGNKKVAVFVNFFLLIVQVLDVLVNNTL
jgi:hypothetical protein